MLYLLSIMNIYEVRIDSAAKRNNERFECLNYIYAFNLIFVKQILNCLPHLIVQFYAYYFFLQ